MAALVHTTVELGNGLRILSSSRLCGRGGLTAVRGATRVTALAILSAPGATLRVMDTLSDIPDTSYELPLSEADQAALRPALLRDLGAMPFTLGAPISRSLWVIFIGEWGAWTHAVLPVDDSLGMPDDENLTGLCDLIGSLLRPPRCHDDEKAMIVLRRPGSPQVSDADAHIFRQVRQAAARRETAPWAFHVVGPAGTREVTEHEARQDPARTPAGITGSAEEFPEDGGSPGRNLFVGEELRAYLEGHLGGIDRDDAGKETKVIDVAGPGGECLHGKDVAR